MGLGVTEINEHTIPHVLRHEPTEAPHSLGDTLLVGGNHLAEVLGVDPCRECCRTHKVGEHHPDLSAFGGILRLRLCSSDAFKGRWGGARNLADRSLHYPPMPERDADVLQVLIGQ